MRFSFRLSRFYRIFSLVVAGTLMSLTLSMCAMRPVAEKNPPLPTEAMLQAGKVCGTLTAPLTQEEQDYAKVAWQYFVNNEQEKTGLTNSVDSFPSGTLWDMGNYLTAMNAARWMGLIDQSEFDIRLNTFLTTLGKLPLFEKALPNKVYNTETGDKVDYSNQVSRKGIGWSALDLGRMLAALDVIRTCHPQYTDWVEGIVERWHLGRSIDKGQLYGAMIQKDGSTLLVQEGRLGYEEYAARGYELWGYDPKKALAIAPSKKVKVEGIDLTVDSRDYQKTDANNYVVSESYILEGIEFGLDGVLKEQAKQVFDVQKQRYERTGKLTAVSEDNVDQDPHFLYNTVYANGKPWAVITEDNEAHSELRTLSTKAAFGWHYLYPKDSYGKQIFNAVKTLQDPEKGGFFAGLYEANGKTNEILTGNTNGLLLEILYFKALGNKPLIHMAKAQPSTVESTESST